MTFFKNTLYSYYTRCATDIQMFLNRIFEILYSLYIYRQYTTLILAIALWGAKLVLSLASCSFVFMVYLQLIDHEFFINTSMGSNLIFA